MVNGIQKGKVVSTVGGASCKGAWNHPPRQDWSKSGSPAGLDKSGASKSIKSPGLKKRTF